MAKRVIFDKKNILVTGGAGFIGSHLCDELIKEAKVICLDNFSTGNEKNIDHLLSEPDFEFIRHDITEPIALEDLPELQKFKIEFQGIQEIYHLACPMSPKNFNKNKIATLLANSYGTKNALDLALKHKAKILHYSSSVIYGYEGKGGKKVSEEDLGAVDTLSERSAYDEGKRYAEAMIMNYRLEHKIDAKIMRLFRTYGPRMPLQDGQMIPDFINNALDGEDLIVYGDKEFNSSFCYISDVVDASRKLMDSELSGPINIGSDVPINLTVLAQKIVDRIKAKSKITYSDELIFMKPLYIPDITIARNELNWMPVIPIDQGLQNTIYELQASKGLKGVKHAVEDK
jgi:UDP-glucuronate decarboxylase